MNSGSSFSEPARTTLQRNGLFLSGLRGLELLGRVLEHREDQFLRADQRAELDDLELIARDGRGAIIGTALFVGNFTLTEALAVVRDPVMS